MLVNIYHIFIVKHNISLKKDLKMIQIDIYFRYETVQLFLCIKY